MKIYITLFIAIVTLFTSCEDVVDIDLNSSEPKLVIEASINWEKGTIGNEQEIKLTLTTPYYDSHIPPANGAIVSIVDSSSTGTSGTSGSSGSTGGGGSSGGSTTGGTTCQPTWDCSEWSNNAQQCGTRICNDLNNCENSKKPKEK